MANNSRQAQANRRFLTSCSADIEAKNMDKGSPMLVRLFKQEAELEVWKQNRDGKFALLKTYPICRWSGDLGPKGEGRRPAGTGRLLFDHPSADESEFGLLSVVQHGLPECL